MIDIKFSPIPKHGDLILMNEFKKYCYEGMFIDYDGYGYLSTKTKVSDVVIRPSMLDNKKCIIPNWATHVMWFNR